MKILQINKFFFLRGGAESYFFDVSKLLKQNGHQVIHFSTKNKHNFDFGSQNDFVKFNDLSQREGFVRDIFKAIDIFWNREVNRKLEALIEREKPDIAHCHNIFSHLSPAVFAVLKKHKIPIVLSLHDPKLFCPNYKFYTQNKICYRCLERKSYWPATRYKCLKNSLSQSILGSLEMIWANKILKTEKKIDVFLSPSEFLAKKALDWGIEREKVEHLPYFIEPLKNEESEQGEKYIFFFSRFVEEKGAKELVEAFKSIAGQFPEWKLIMANDGPEKEKVMILAKDCGQVEFIGKKTREEIFDLIKKSSLVVLPSLWPDNFPYCVLESYSLGKPVLASDSGGLPEMIENGKTGLLFKTGDEEDLREKLVWALSNENKLKEMGQAGRRKILEKCDKEKHYQKLMEIYEKVEKK